MDDDLARGQRQDPPVGGHTAMMSSPAAMRSRFDELQARGASLEDWCAFAERLENVVREQQSAVLKLNERIARHEQGAPVPDIDDVRSTARGVITDFRALDALRREAAATVEELRSNSTRELEPVRRGG